MGGKLDQYHPNLVSNKESNRLINNKPIESIDSEV